MQERTEPPRDCPLCPRLVAFRETWREKEPSWHNAPVPTWSDGDDAVRLLVVGLAPGLRGANSTGRPFTGDYAGDLLYETMLEFGFAKGTYAARPDDGLRLVNAAITNSVRCVPPENKPTGEEITTCRRFLVPTIKRYPNLRALLSLGAIAHQSTLKAFGLKLAAHKFKHGARFEAEGMALYSSYHCSRYNTNTGVLTPEMFRAVFRAIAEEVG
ncbi:MAG: uracil-DNA glycosylase [Mesorhizobium amorphae]|nr:MAG: uracil-DNA glycosylase [Mesorhizobium amorphae]